MNRRFSAAAQGFGSRAAVLILERCGADSGEGAAHYVHRFELFYLFAKSGVVWRDQKEHNDSTSNTIVPDDRSDSYERASVSRVGDLLAA